MRKLFFLTFFLFINTLVTRDRINVSKLSNHSLEPFLKFSCNICFSNFFNISKVEEGFFFGGIMQTCPIYKIWMKKEPKKIIINSCIGIVSTLHYSKIFLHVF